MDALFSKDPRSLKAVALAAVWETLQPGDPLTMPPTADPLCSVVASGIAGYMATAADAQVNLVNTRQAMRELAKFSVEENEECQRGGEESPDGSDDADSAAQEMGVANRTLPGEAMEANEAEAVENLVSREYNKDEEKGLPALGRQYGDKEVPCYTIRGERSAAIASRYRDTLARVRPLVALTRASLIFRNEVASMDEHGLRRGLVDEGGLHKALEGDPTLFRRNDVVAAPEVDVGILVDESGSMGIAARRSDWSLTRADMARQCAVLLHEACKGLRGVRVSVWGHTGSTELCHDGVLVTRYIEAGQGDPTTLGAITQRAENADGVAIGYCAGKLDAMAQGRNRVLFILSDGEPSAPGYGGTPALKHVREVVKAARKRGISVFMLGMGGGLSEVQAEQMFGKDGYALIEDATKLPRALSGLLTKALRSGRVGA
jgi:hypothetical protein